MCAGRACNDGVLWGLPVSGVHTRRAGWRRAPGYRRRSATWQGRNKCMLKEWMKTFIHFLASVFNSVSRFGGRGNSWLVFIFLSYNSRTRIAWGDWNSISGGCASSRLLQMCPVSHPLFALWPDVWFDQEPYFCPPLAPQFFPFSFSSITTVFGMKQLFFILVGKEGNYFLFFLFIKIKIS